MLGIGYLHLKDGAPDAQLIKAGGGFGLAAAILAWYNALAGIADTSNRYVAPHPWFFLSHPSRQAAPGRPNPTCVQISRNPANGRMFANYAFCYSFFIIPVAHFPWSAKGRAARSDDKTA